MRASIIVFVTLVAAVWGASVPTYNTYHETVGIPLATKLKALEEEAINAGRTSVGRIAGGELTNHSRIPYHAGYVIELPTRTSCCGGSLIGNNRVVTAAHCVYDGAQMTVVFNSNFIFYGGTRRVVTSSVVHAQYDEATINNDIALLYFPAIEFTDNIQPIALPSDNEVTNNFIGFAAVASGHGITPEVPSLTFEQQLRQVTALVISPGECGQAFGFFGSRDTTICTSGEGGVGICSSDSGGPLATLSSGRNVLIGVSSFGSVCGDGRPSGYVRVTQYLDWLAEN